MSRFSQGDLRLVLAELIQHIGQVRAYLAAPSAPAMAELAHRAAYINILARNHNFDLEKPQEGGEKNRRLRHGLAAITSQLRRVSELALNVARQRDHLKGADLLRDYDLDIFFDEISFGLSLIRPALAQRKLKLALCLCRVEERLDTQYAIRFARLVEELERGGERGGSLVTVLMIIHYLERVGDLFLEIGEELIYILLGQSLKFSQYQALGVGLRASGRGEGKPEGGGAKFESIWSGRSGCRINVLRPGAAASAPGEAVLFKHGPATKMEEERESLESWAALWPTLPPAVLAFVPAGPGNEAGLLLEYIHGETLHEMMMAGDFARAIRELTGVLNLMGALWKETRVDEEAGAGFARQAEKRLGALRALHPGLVNFHGDFCGLHIDPLDQIMKQAAETEALVPAPFSVRIHGDFNLSNVMRDELGSYRLIDLHRSRLSDYAQDLSVMIISILRLPLRGAEARKSLAGAAGLVWTFARDFAASGNDPTIEARLAFGLARSYLSSARFEARRSRAAAYIGYSRHIWQRLIDHSRAGIPMENFRLDKQLLFI